MRVSLKAARINANLGQKEAASEIGVSPETLANWEKGKSYPNVPQITRIEEVYGLKYDDIIFLPTVSV
jgi:DNA-binding XRE family transcriptional regulator